MKKIFWSNETYIKLIKCWLTGILVLIPFQPNIVRLIKPWNDRIASSVNSLDEFTVVIFIFLAIREFYKRREIFNHLIITISCSILFVIITGIISGVENGNSFFITVLGIFIYIKILLIVLIYAAFFKEFSEIKKIFRFLVVMAIILGFIALIQELWALGNRYLLGNNIHETGMYLLRTYNRVELAERHWRLGIYRAPSLLHHSSFMGFYSLFILTIYLYMSKKANYAVLIPLVTGIFTSVSRVVYAGFMTITGFRILNSWKRIILVLLPVMIGLSLMIFLTDLNISEIFDIPVLKDVKMAFLNSNQEGVPFRKYTSDKALEIIKDHPLLGVGPGMFGGVISIKYNSYVYDEYNFRGNWLFHQSMGIDIFWPQLLAETGIIGCMMFIVCYSFLSVLLIELRSQTSVQEEKCFFKGLLIFMIMIIIWSLGRGLNNAVVFTFLAFAGMSLGSSIKQQ